MNALVTTMHRLIYLPVGVLAAAAVVVAAWALDREPPLTFKGNVQVEQQTGHTVRISYDVERHRFCDLTVQRSVRDADGYRFQMSESEYGADEIMGFELDRPGRVMLTLPIPKSARRGAMLVRVTLLYVCNPLHEIWPIRVAYTVPFMADN